VTSALHTPALIVAEVTNDSGDAQLITAAVLGIATVIVLITVMKMHPFLALILGSAVLGVVAGLPVGQTIDSFTGGVGATVGGVGILIALGAMIGGLLADTGGADRVVKTVVDHVPLRMLPWAIAGVAALLGLPLFFEVGVVLLLPVVLLVAYRTRIPLLLIGIPALAGLSVLHGFVPPHPGPLVAIDAVKADIGVTLALGILVAIPTVIIAGPLFAQFITRYVQVDVPMTLIPVSEREHEPVAAAATTGGGSATSRLDDAGDLGHSDERDRGPVAPRDTAAGTDGVDTTDGVDRPRRGPSFAATVTTVLIPVVLMLLRALAELLLEDGSRLRTILEIAGEPIVALLAGVLFGMVALGIPAGFDRARVSASVGGALPAVAGIILIVGAGGGFKQTLIDAGVGRMIGEAAKGSSISPLILGWLVAVGIRLATGSATVATITASGIVAPLAVGLGSTELALLVLAIGAGSVFFSHVNDAGFWLVKEYFGMSVGQTIATWSVMETIISVVGLACVMLLNLLL
jgi:GntP family gluconate:H+ symporter